MISVTFSSTFSHPIDDGGGGGGGSLGVNTGPSPWLPHFLVAVVVLEASEASCLALNLARQSGKTTSFLRFQWSLSAGERVTVSWATFSSSGGNTCFCTEVQ